MGGHHFLPALLLSAFFLAPVMHFDENGARGNHCVFPHLYQITNPPIFSESNNYKETERGCMKRFHVML